MLKAASEYRIAVMIRLRKETEAALRTLAQEKGLRTGPFCVHVMESIAKCPPDKFHSAMAEFLKETARR